MRRGSRARWSGSRRRRTRCTEARRRAVLARRRRLTRVRREALRARRAAVHVRAGGCGELVRLGTGGAARQPRSRQLRAGELRRCAGGRAAQRGAGPAVCEGAEGEAGGGSRPALRSSLAPHGRASRRLTRALCCRATTGGRLRCSCWASTRMRRVAGLRPSAPMPCRLTRARDSCATTSAWPR